MARTRTQVDIWVFQDEGLGDVDLTGFKVEGRDGKDLGTVHEATRETGASYIVVLTGPWFFSNKAMLPAGMVDRVDLDTETVFVRASKDDIENAPKFDQASYREAAYHDELGTYYGSRGRT